MKKLDLNKHLHESVWLETYFSEPERRPPVAGDEDKSDDNQQVEIF
ncbi:MAG: hypothetical protein H6993_04865 [Pseudomonadales bacterium]|nr:hypothetical protein [Pseudomonadales bacterium]MCP5183270.1 hypothetical protein [Pseudomonadales bacterium]